jgi:hypothetical protein
MYVTSAAIVSGPELRPPGFDANAPRGGGLYRSTPGHTRGRCVSLSSSLLLGLVIGVFSTSKIVTAYSPTLPVWTVLKIGRGLPMASTKSRRNSAALAPSTTR